MTHGNRLLWCGMAVNRKTTVRKIASLPTETAAWIAEFRASQMPEASESEVLKYLIEVGLETLETPQHLMERCSAATEAGTTVGNVYAKILEFHPLIGHVDITEKNLKATLKSGSFIVFDKYGQHWELDPIL